MHHYFLNVVRVFSELSFHDCDISLQERVWGVAYQIPQENVEDVRNHLNFREKQGYDATVVTFHPDDESIEPFQLTIYTGDAENPFYLGPAPIDDIAKQIYRSAGESGKNTEYLLELAKAVRDLTPHVEDSHLFELEKAVISLCQNEGLS